METDNDILGPVKRREVEEGTLVQRLTEYVERIDTDMVRPLAGVVTSRLFLFGVVHIPSPSRSGTSDCFQPLKQLRADVMPDARFRVSAEHDKK